MAGRIADDAVVGYVAVFTANRAWLHSNLRIGITSSPGVRPSASVDGTYVECGTTLQSVNQATDGSSTGFNCKLASGSIRALGGEQWVQIDTNYNLDDLVVREVQAYVANF
jgi:hypothetical protein